MLDVRGIEQFLNDRRREWLIPAPIFGYPLNSRGGDELLSWFDASCRGVTAVKQADNIRFRIVESDFFDSREV